MGDNKIVIYQTTDGQTAIDLKLEKDTIWLTQSQIAELFETQNREIEEHLSNIFRANELEEGSVSSILEHIADDGKIYQLKHYNLDAILSVGYRVNSKSATHFRVWVNKVLKEYLIRGYALNEKELLDKNEEFQALKQTVKILGNALSAQQSPSDETTDLLKIITDYTYALDVLDKYDHRTLTIEAIHTKQYFIATYDEAMKAIQGLREKFGGSRLFGNEKDESFQSSIATIYQSFGGQELYPSIEEKAASFLYFVVKNHSFSDGNKRIAAFLFVWFLAKNNVLYREDGSKRIADNALVALTLMIAESKPDEKDVIVQVVVNLINGYN